MKTIYLAASLLALSLGVAQAGEGNGNPFPNNAAGGVVTFNQVLNDNGSQSTPRLGGTLGRLTQGDVVPVQANSAGTVQTANSLPANAEAGTIPTMQYAAMQRWAATHDAIRAERLALASRQ